MEESVQAIELKQYIFEKYIDNRTIADKYLVDSIESLNAQEQETKQKIIRLDELIVLTESELKETKKENKELKENLKEKDKQINQINGNIESIKKENDLLNSIVKDLIKTVEELKKKAQDTISNANPISQAKETEKDEANSSSDMDIDEELVFVKRQEQKTIEIKEEEQKTTEIIKKEEQVPLEKKEEKKEIERKEEIKTIEKKEEIEVVELEDDLHLEKELKNIIEGLCEKKVVDIIYKGSEEGFSAEEFNRCVGSYKKVMFVVKTNNNELFGGYCSDVPVVDDVARGVYGDKEHFVFTVKNNKPIKFIKRETNSYSTWLFPDDSENIISFAGAFVISGNCGDNEESRLSGNFIREYIDNGENIIDHPNFKVTEFLALQLE